MKLRVAGRDREPDLGRRLQDSIRSRQAEALQLLLTGNMDVLELGDAQSETDYRQRHMALLRQRHYVDPSWFTLPPARPPAGRLMRGLRYGLWRCMKWAFDTMAFHQNTINAQLMFGQEFEREARRKHDAEVEQRLTALESKVSGDPGEGRR